MAFDKNNIKAFPKKSLGQNFLVDENISKKIINTFDIKENDLVLEIGPGYGSLTKHILTKTKNVICVELDTLISEYLRTTFPDIKIMNQDFLKIDLNELCEGKNLRIIGNIPYNITTHILFHIIDNRTKVKDASIMMQLDVAKRIVAMPRTKDYGILSIFSQTYSKPELRFKIPPQCFFPKPKIFSGILYFDFTKNISDEIKDDKLFREVVRTSFGKRRKIMSNSLKDLSMEFKTEDINFDFNKRPEELSKEEFINLSNELFAIKPFPDSIGAQSASGGESKFEK